MPNVTGYVYYDPTRTGTPGTGLKNVPVALYNSVSGIGAVALTDSTGAYLFTNVPAGNYNVIECWGTAGSVTPINFGTTATAMVQPTEKEPPLSIVTVPVPPLADALCALNPNLQKIIVTTSNIGNILFFDAPVGDKPLVFTGVNFIGPNLITVADNGTWGTNPGGTPIMTISPTDPYPGVSPGFVYVNSATPSDGKFSVMNTRTVTTYPWWPVSDHTSMIETGRVLTVNGANKGSIIFKQAVTVLPNTDYALTAWIMNLINQTSGYVNPMLALSVKDSNNNQIFYQAVNSIDAQNVPIWYQNGFLFNTLSNSSITVEILSEGEAAVGNDYLIDDVALYQVELQHLLTIKKTATPAVIHAGTDVTITVIVKNNSSISTLNDVIFKDILDPTLVFTPGSVTVNGSGTGYATANPNVGFSIGNMAPNAVNTVVFHAVATAGGSPVKNVATGSYPAFLSANGDKILETTNSNPVFLRRPKYNFGQASTDIVESIALQETGISHILNAEGEKIQAMLAMPNVTATQLLAVNASVENMIDSITELECVMKKKIKLVKNQVVGYKII
ncbi:MAG: hypothetical protein RR334_00985 [Clostridia bacterium]